MKRNRLKGIAIIEFSFSVLVLVPLVLGTMGFGIRLVQSIQTVQLARDGARMYSRGLDFSLPGNKTTLATLGADVGLQTGNSGTAVVIFSTVTYVDKGVCQSAGKSDSGGNPLGCTNYMKWVFTQRLVVGNTTFRTSNLGSPLATGPGAVTVDPNTAKISLNDQATNAGDVAVFTAGNPFFNIPGTLITLPSGQELYVTEAASQGFVMPPFANGGMMYAFNVF